MAACEPQVKATSTSTSPSQSTILVNERPTSGALYYMLYYMSTSSNNLRQHSCIKFVSKEKSEPEKHQKVPTTNSDRVDVTKTSNNERARAKWPLDSDRRCRRLSTAVCMLRNSYAQKTPRVCDRSIMCASGRTAAAAPCTTASNRLNASCAHKRARAYERQQR